MTFSPQIRGGIAAISLYQFGKEKCIKNVKKYVKKMKYLSDYSKQQRQGGIFVGILKKIWNVLWISVAVFLLVVFLTAARMSFFDTYIQNDLKNNVIYKSIIDENNKNHK